MPPKINNYRLSLSRIAMIVKWKDECFALALPFVYFFLTCGVSYAIIKAVDVFERFVI